MQPEAVDVRLTPAMAAGDLGVCQAKDGPRRLAPATAVASTGVSGESEQKDRGQAARPQQSSAPVGVRHGVC